MLHLKPLQRQKQIQWEHWCSSACMKVAWTLWILPCDEGHDEVNNLTYLTTLTRVENMRHLRVVGACMKNKMWLGHLQFWARHCLRRPRETVSQPWFVKKQPHKGREWKIGLKAGSENSGGINTWRLGYSENTATQLTRGRTRQKSLPDPNFASAKWTLSPSNQPLMWLVQGKWPHPSQVQLSPKLSISARWTWMKVKECST